MAATARIGGLFVYPVKGGAAVPVAESVVSRRGLAHDRRWAVATDTGRVLTQREYAQLARIHAWIDHDGALGFQIEGERFEAPEAGSGRREAVRVWGDTVEAEAYDGRIDTALSELLGRRVRLVHFPDDTTRPCDPQIAPGAETAFADGYPILLTNEATLVWLDEKLVELGAFPVPMSRFRPNVVLTGAAANAEDEHSRLVADGLVMELVKSCERCVVTTIDQETGTPDGDQPLAALRRLRLHPLLRQPVFGQNAVPLLAPGETGRLEVDASVTLEGSAAI